MAALAGLGDGPEELRATYLNRTCALDGITEVTGCSEENGLLQVRSTGEHRLLLERGGQVVEATLSPQTLRRAGEYRQLSSCLETGWDDLGPVERQRRRMQLDAALDGLLPYLWQASESEILTLTRRLSDG